MRRYHSLGLILAVLLSAAGSLAASPTAPDSGAQATREPRHLTIYIVPHSHVDIGYTELQTDIEDKQVGNLLAGMAVARRTANYPEGARFVWNLEGAWAADLLLRRLNPAQRADLVTAVQRGEVALTGMYTNTLTGLCRPEELTQLFRFATQLRTLTGVPLDTAMFSDLPACTWGIVPAMAQAGLKYLSSAPNHAARLGDIHTQWDNKPFWWIGPSGRDRVLVWLPSWGYGLSQRVHRQYEQWLTGYVQELERSAYPYDISYVRWTGDGDNATPDPAICDFVRDWNASHAWPRLVIASAHDAFQALEKKYGAQLPQMRGDLTPYWEDGAGSTARETAMNRATSDRLAQADALWAIQQPASYPAGAFADAMRHVLLFDEHSWGSSKSVSAPTDPASLAQWSIKQGYAATADIESRDLLSRALALSTAGEPINAVDIFNTSSWLRDGVMILPKHFTAAGNAVTDDTGAPVPAQRLTSGELAVLARNVPAYSSRRYMIGKGESPGTENVTITPTTLGNGLISISLDPKNGGLTELRGKDIGTNLVDHTDGELLNEYLYFNGRDSSRAQTNGPVSIRIKEKGPLIASLVVESSAPGCRALVREITLVAGRDWIEVTDLVDKDRLIATSYFHALDGKESVNFAFPFAVPGGQVRLDVPFGVVRPDLDQIPGASKNWFPINRWADVSNAEFGVTWVSLDSPLVEVGGLTANIISARGNPLTWKNEVGPTQKLYAWVMNNQWNTNYRPYQEGPVTFRFLLRPHLAFDAGVASRFAIAASQPLLPVRVSGPRPVPLPRLSIDSPDVIVTGLKPSDDGRAMIIRLWGAAGRDAHVHITWSTPYPRQVCLSDTSETPLDKITDDIFVPAWGLVTLRAESP